MMNKKTVQVLAILILTTGVRAETVVLDGNRSGAPNSPQAPVQLNDQMITPWAWKNVKEAVDGVAKQADLTVNYSALNSVQLDLLSTRNVVLESRKPLHWKVLLGEVLRGLKLDFIQNDAGVVEVMPFDRFHAYKTEEAERNLQNNHAVITNVVFNRMPLLQAIKDLTEQAKVSLNTGYLPLEIRDPEAAAKKAAELAVAKTDTKDKTQAPPPQVKDYETSFKTVTPMEWRNVLRNILDPHGFDFVEIDGAVCPMDKKQTAEKNASLLAAKPLIRQIVPVFYADPTDLIKRIGELGVLSPRGKVTLTQSPGLNTISSGSSSGGSSSGGSRGGSSSGGSSRGGSSSGGLSRGGSSGGGSSGGSSGSGSMRPRVREDLVVSDVEANVVQATEWIRKLDVSDGQVMIQAHILSIDDTDTKNLGVAWSGLDQSVALTPQSFFNFNGSNAWSQTYLNGHPTGSGDIKGGMSAILAPPQLSATLHALDVRGNTERLSHPLVVLGNRTEGQIDVQSIIPYYEQQVQTISSTTPISTTSLTWEEIETGLKLWVCPEIAPDGKHVRLSVNQSMIDFDGYEIGPTAASKYPKTTERFLDTRAMVRDGDTLVIGGLVTTTHTVTDSKVPFIGSIPLLGRLFSYKDNKVDKKNLVIMITPTILNEDTPATGYEPKSEAKADELSALGKDYFYNKPEKMEDGLSAEAKKAQEEEQPVVSGVEPKAAAVDQPSTQQLSPVAREPEVQEIVQTLETGK